MSEQPAPERPDEADPRSRIGPAHIRRAVDVTAIEDAARLAARDQKYVLEWFLNRYLKELRHRPLR